MSGYGEHALTYGEKGWHVFPLPDGEKSPPPKGRTGRDGRNATRAEIKREAEINPSSNIAVRVTGGMIGIDVDAYDGKPGAETLATLIEELGSLPATVLTTSREDIASGIRFFRVPVGMEFITKMPGIEICQTHHRYALVWPSTHDKTGLPYRWLNSITREPVEMPNVEDLPMLPEVWIERLRSDNTSNTDKASTTNAETVRIIGTWLSAGEPCSHMNAAMRRAVEAVRRGEARHDTTLQAQLAIIRYAEAGHPGGREALALLRRWFFEVIGTDRDVSGEWTDGIVGAGKTVISEPSTEASRGCESEAAFDVDPDDIPAGAEPDVFDGDDDDEGGEDDGAAERGRDGRRRLNVRNRKTAGDTLRDLIGTEELAGLFFRDGELVHCPHVGEQGYEEPDDGDDGPAQIRLMNPVELKTLVEIEMSPGQGRRRPVTTTGDDGEETTVQRLSWEPKMIPLEVAAHVHTAARSRNGVPNLRTLAGVTHTPIVRLDGSIVNSPGYDTGSRMLYLPDAGLRVADLPSPITRADIDAAVSYLSAIVAQFPFVEEFHRANWFGALFTPFMRIMLPPPYPAFVIDAPSPGSGKSYLAGILRTVHGGVIRTGWPSDDAEFSKSVLGILTGTTSPVVTFDNVRGKIRSAKFEGLLTTASFSDRLLGQNRDASAPNDRLWTITANNAEIGGDLARRCYWITIDPKMPRPHERTGFALDLRTWPVANRGEIIRAMLTIIRGWVLAGSPKADQKRSDDYATWDAAMEGMLNWAGFTGQFGFRDMARVDSDDDQEWGAFIESVYRVFGDKPFKIKDIVGKLNDSAGEGEESIFAGESSTPVVIDKIDPVCLPGELADKWSKTGLGSPAGFTKSLGRWVKNRVGRYVGDLAFDHVKADAKKGDTYRVVRFT